MLTGVDILIENTAKNALVSDLQLLIGDRTPRNMSSERGFRTGLWGQGVTCPFTSLEAVVPAVMGGDVRTRHFMGQSREPGIVHRKHTPSQADMTESLPM